MSEAGAGRIKNLKVLEYVRVASQTRYARATGAQQTFNARLTHAWGTLPKRYLIKSQRACGVHWRAQNVSRTRSKRIQRTCNAHGTYSKRIRHTPETHRTSRKFLSMFKLFWAQTRLERAATYNNVYQRAPSVQNARVTRF